MNVMCLLGMSNLEPPHNKNMLIPKHDERDITYRNTSSSCKYVDTLRLADIVLQNYNLGELWYVCGQYMFKVSV